MATPRGGWRRTCGPAASIPDQVDEATFASYLYTDGMSDPDLLIRTAGEMRISNFLLWQISYSELWVTPTLWPDFRGDDLIEGCRAFAGRERKFGGLPAAGGGYGACAATAWLAAVERRAVDFVPADRRMLVPVSVDRTNHPTPDRAREHALDPRFYRPLAWSPGSCSRSSPMNGWRRGIRSGSCLSGLRVGLGGPRARSGLLDATSARPSGNSVIGGVLALLVANWLPHVAVPPDPLDGVSALDLRRRRPLNVLAWPFLCFAVVLMVSFVVQSLQFEKPGRTMAKIAGTILAVGYVGLLGSFHDPDAMV